MLIYLLMLFLVKRGHTQKMPLKNETDPLNQRVNCHIFLIANY